MSKIQCTACSKPVDTDVNAIPPTWYAKYRAGIIIEAICAACLATPKGQEKWDDPS